MADVTITLLRTKLHRPPVRPPVTHDLVSRPYLLKQLNRGLDRNLTLVSAPVGFGKTTLISSWLDAVSGDCRPQLPATWLSLDEHDSDLTVFLHYLVAAVRPERRSRHVVAGPLFASVIGVLQLVLHDPVVAFRRGDSEIPV